MVWTVRSPTKAPLQFVQSWRIGRHWNPLKNCWQTCQIISSKTWRLFKKQDTICNDITDFLLHHFEFVKSGDDQIFPNIADTKKIKSVLFSKDLFNSRVARVDALALACKRVPSLPFFKKWTLEYPFRMALSKKYT